MIPWIDPSESVNPFNTRTIRGARNPLEQESPSIGSSQSQQISIHFELWQQGFDLQDDAFVDHGIAGKGSEPPIVWWTRIIVAGLLWTRKIREGCCCHTGGAAKGGLGTQRKRRFASQSQHGLRLSNSFAEWGFDD